MLNTYYDLPVSFFGSEVNSVKKKNSPLDPRVTSVATEILEMAHGLKEYGQLYKNKPLMDRFKNDSNIDNLALAKIQRRFTTLKGRVEKLKDVDPRIEGIFKKMVKVGIDDRSKRGGLESINRDVLSLIGKKNIIDSGPFSKHGIICVKDSAMPDPCPSNLVSATELKEMHCIINKLFDKKRPLIKFKDKHFPDIFAKIKFIAKTKNSFEKLLTIKAGRELLKKLSNNMDVFTIKPGQNNEVTPSKNKIVLNQKNSAIIGRENGFNVSISSPRWIGLGHELIHISHYYDDTFISNKKTYTIPDRNLWGDGEEYATIGDPKKPITPISENGIRQDSLHPLRIYHRGSIKSNDFEEIFQQCISSNINGDLIAMLQNNKFIDSNVGKKIIQENFQLFFAFAKLKNDEAIVQKMSSQFPDEYNAFQKNPKREMFLHMARVYPNLLIKWYTSSDNKKYFNLSDDQIEKINSKLMTKFDMELWIAISEIK